MHAPVTSDVLRRCREVGIRQAAPSGHRFAGTPQHARHDVPTLPTRPRGQLSHATNRCVSVWYTTATYRHRRIRIISEGSEFAARLLAFTASGNHSTPATDAVSRPGCNVCSERQQRRPANQKFHQIRRLACAQVLNHVGQRRRRCMHPAPRPDPRAPGPLGLGQRSSSMRPPSAHVRPNMCNRCRKTTRYDTLYSYDRSLYVAT